MEKCYDNEHKHQQWRAHKHLFGLVDLLLQVVLSYNKLFSFFIFKLLHCSHFSCRRTKPKTNPLKSPINLLQMRVMWCMFMNRSWDPRARPLDLTWVWTSAKRSSDSTSHQVTPSPMHICATSTLILCHKTLLCWSRQKFWILKWGHALWQKSAVQGWRIYPQTRKHNQRFACEKALVCQAQMYFYVHLICIKQIHFVRLIMASIDRLQWIYLQTVRCQQA